MRLHSRIFLLVGLCCLLGLPAWAANEPSAPEPVPVCGDDERIAYQEAAESGVSAEELADQFAHCRFDGSDGLQKTITINNAVGSTFYEQMNGCGYHPQIGVAACDVEVKRTTWYGNYPAGSNEHVTFCFQCGGGWTAVPGAVHVTNDISGAAPSYGFMAYAVAPPLCPPPGGGTGVAFQVRATLSWAVPAGNPCANNPTLVWGNQITFDTRDDP